MDLNNKYGYKVCYRKVGRSKTKIFLVTNSYDAALWNVRWYEKAPPTKVKVSNPIWEIQEVKTVKEYNKLWKGCPFKDDLSAL